MENRRTFEYFIIGGILALGAPCALLLGRQSGEATAADTSTSGLPGETCYDVALQRRAQTPLATHRSRSLREESGACAESWSASNA